MLEQDGGGKLDFYQAMQDFRTMFPSLDESLIESVLRAHRGAVDDTIDALLALSITDSADGIKLNLALKLQGEIFKEKMAENDWKRHLNNDPELEQYLEDERIALMLQNEEFLLHLENDPDFLAALEKDRRVKKSKSYRTDVKFSNSKRKFAILARKFNYKKKGAKAIIGDNQSNYVDVGLLGGAYLNDESDLLIDEQENFGAGASSSAGYNQREDDNYNISHRTDLKEGRLFSTYKS